MSLSSAHKSIALVCQVLDLPLAQHCGSGQWFIWVNEIAIEVSYCAKSDELRISHKLTALKQLLTASDFDAAKKFTECYLSCQRHWIEINCKDELIALHSKIDLSDDNDFALSIEIPFFAQLCSRWPSFDQSAKMPDPLFPQKSKKILGLCLQEQNSPPSILAPCKSQHFL